VATAFLEWQNACVEAVRAVYDEVGDKVDDGKVRDVLSEKGLIKDKRAMPFVQAFKVGLFLFQVVWACLFNFLTPCFVETHGAVWCTDSVPSDAAVLGS